MAGIKVELKHGRLGWYVVADFNDGTLPITKGPMAEADARTMLSELETEAAGSDFVQVRERSEEEAIANRRAAILFFCLVVVGFTTGAAVALLWGRS